MSAGVLFAAVGAVGGVAAVLAPLWIARRAHRRELQAAARVVVAELKRAHDWIVFALDENAWDALATEPPHIPSWDQNAQLLAAGLRRGDRWNTVYDAIKAIESVGVSAKRAPPDGRIFPTPAGEGPAEADRDELIEDRDKIRDAIYLLSRTAGWKTPREELDFIREFEDDEAADANDPGP